MAAQFKSLQCSFPSQQSIYYTTGHERTEHFRTEQNNSLVQSIFRCKQQYKSPDLNTPQNKTMQKKTTHKNITHQWML